MESIFCAYDFSDAANSALAYAARLSDLFNAKLSLVYIYNIPVPVTEFGYVDVSDEVIKKNALQDLEKVKEGLLSEHKNIKGIDIIVETGMVNYKLNKIASDKTCDLLVMGIDNDKDFVKEHLLGSNSIEEARKYKIPVLIVPKNCENNKITSIVYACDYSQNLAESTSLIQVRYYATMFNADLKILHVLEPAHELNKTEIMSDRYIENQMGNTGHKTFLVYEHNASEGIINFVNEHKVDMIIVEPHHRNFFERLFQKSTTRELAFHVNKPILAIHGD